MVDRQTYSDAAFDPHSAELYAVLTWLRRERSYVLRKWGPRNQENRGSSDYPAWRADVDMYLHRTQMLLDDGVFTPAAMQSLAKAAAVIASLLILAQTEGIPLPPGGLPSGQLERLKK